MSDEQDGFMLNAFGVDLGQLAQNVKDEGAAVLGQVASTVSQVVQGVQGAVEGAIDGAIGATVGAVKAVGEKVSSLSSGPGSGAGAGSFPLGGSVGRGGKNAPNDVRAVQAALGISADGQCGGGTIAAIEAFQRTMGQAKPDGRVDAGGRTERALAGGAGGAPAAAPAPEPAKEADDSGSLIDQVVGGAKDLGGKILKEAKEDLDAATAVGGEVLKGAADLPGGAAAQNALGASGSTLSDSIDSLLGIGVGGQFSFPALAALPPDPGFPIGTVAFGQFAGKLSVKFKPTLLSSIKAPNPKEAEAGIRAICNELYENATFKWFGGVTVKGDTKSAGVAASFLKVSTKVGAVTLDIKAFEIGLDIKKIVKASFGSTSANFPTFEQEVNGVNYEIDISLGGALEVSPDPAAGAAAFTSGGILLAIDVALVAGPPLAAAAVIGVGIFMAGEKGARDEAILEGAVDARQAAFDYAITMTGSEGSGPGPRAKAAVAVAKAELSKVAASQKVSLEELMTALRNDKNQPSDFQRIHAQARQQIFGAYFGEVRGHLAAWRKEHSVLAAFTTEADDNIAVDKLVSTEFERP